MAQEPDATFEIKYGLPDSFDLEENGIHLSGNMGSNALNLYSPWSWNATVSCEAFAIEKVEMIGVRGSVLNQLFADSGTSSYSGTNYTWTGNANSILFSSGGADYYITTVKVGLAAAVVPTIYNVNFIGEVPAGCSVSYDGDVFTTNDSFEVAAELTEEDLNVTTTDDYYAKVTYSDGTFSGEISNKPQLSNDRDLEVDTDWDDEF